MKADLHMHSTASDGQYSPSELVSLAKLRGLDVIALTDHDTTDGVEAAVEAGQEANVRVIPGIEMSAKGFKTFHILGYGFSLKSDEFRCAREGMKVSRSSRKQRIADFLRDKGLDVALDEVDRLAGGGIVGRPHFARVMLAMGMVSTWKEAFDNYLDTDEFHETVEIHKKPYQERLSMIKDAGGKLRAHIHISWALITIIWTRWSGKWRKMDWTQLNAIILGIRPGHTPEMVNFYLSLAKKYHLHVTGGSDFHGEKVKPDIRMASLELELEWLIT